MIMKKILLLVPFFLLFSCADSTKLEKKFQQPTNKTVEGPKASEDFVQGSEDIPLLVGMEKIYDGALGFDSASGSIITSSYSTNLEPKQVKFFYLKTLPEMGWRVANNDENSVKLKREKEDLEIEFAKEDKIQVVRFFISSLTQ